MRRREIAALVAVALLLAAMASSSRAATYPDWCPVDQATLLGTEGDDVLHVRYGAGEIVVGMGGDDLIFGFVPDYDDPNYERQPLGAALYGCEGNDVMFGNIADELFYGGPGNDWISTGDGWGDPRFGGGHNHAEGGPGNDTLIGGPARDGLHGGRGDDTLIGRGDNDWLTGGQGRDRAYGGPGPHDWCRAEVRLGCED